MTRQVRRTSTFRPALCLALALVVSAAGCSGSSKSGPSVKLAVRSAPSLDHYVGVTSTRSAGGASLRAFRELWKAFRVEVTLGFPDADHANLGTDGAFAFTVMEGGGVGRYFIVDVTRSGAGIRLGAGTGGAPLGTLTIDDSLLADVVIESVGGIVIFSGRKHGDDAYTSIAAAAAPSAGPYRVAFDLYDIPKGTIVGFDRFRVAANGAPPAPTPARAARETLYTAADALLEAAYALDGPPPDRAAAATAVDLAVTRFDAALAMDLSSYGSVKKRASALRKKAVKLAGGLRGTKQADSVMKSIHSLVTSTGGAANDVED